MSVNIQIINQSKSESVEVQMMITDPATAQLSVPRGEIQTVGPGQVSRTYTVDKLNALTVKEVGG